MTEKLFKLIIRDLKTQSLNSLAKAMGVEQSTLYRIVDGEFRGNISTWEKIQKYYSK